MENRVAIQRPLAPRFLDMLRRLFKAFEIFFGEPMNVYWTIFLPYRKITTTTSASNGKEDCFGMLERCQFGLRLDRSFRGRSTFFGGYDCIHCSSGGSLDHLQRAKKPVYEVIGYVEKMKKARVDEAGCVLDYLWKNLGTRFRPTRD